MGRRTGVLLSEEMIVDAALRRIDEQGLDGLSLRTLGDDLGVTGPALYHYFGTKTDLLMAVARRVITNAPFPEPGETMTWQDWLLAGAKAYRLAILAHPNVAPIFFQIHPRMVSPELVEGTGWIMRASKVPPHLMLMIMDSLESLALGSAMNSVHGVTEFANLEIGDNTAFLLKHNRMTDDERFDLACRSLLAGLPLSESPNGSPARKRVRRAR